MSSPFLTTKLSAVRQNNIQIVARRIDPLPLIDFPTRDESDRKLPSSLARPTSINDGASLALRRRAVFRLVKTIRDWFCA
jgi:hypothetical protein